jgi:hypothetical protein
MDGISVDGARQVHVGAIIVGVHINIVPFGVIGSCEDEA